jgi:hypothetical protein
VCRVLISRARTHTPSPTLGFDSDPSTIDTGSNTAGGAAPSSTTKHASAHASMLSSALVAVAALVVLVLI